MTYKLLALVPLFALVACSGDDDSGTDTGPADTEDTDEFNTTVDSGMGDDDDDDDDGGTAVTDTWDMTVPCDATHTVESLLLDSSNLIQIDLDNAVAAASADGWEFSMDTWEVAVGSGVEVAMTEGTYDDFDSLCQAPPSGFATGNGNLTGWYLYSGPPDHSIDPQDMVFFFRTSDGAYYRLKFDGYYEQNGDLHTPQITFGPVAPPVGG